jgi:hypothetical protein
VQWQFSDKAACDRPGYEYAGLIEWDTGGNNVIIGEPKEVKEDPKGRIAFRFEVQHINFRGNDSVTVVAKIHWRPQRETIDEVTERNKEAIKTFNEQTRYAFRKAFVDAARERIKLASKIEPRKFEELREEERIVVYRALIQDMLTRNISMPDDRTRHVVAELLNTIFDVEKMLYFVCAEWWRPRLHASYQGLGVPEKAPQLPEGGSGASVTQNWDLSSSGGSGMQSAPALNFSGMQSVHTALNFSVSKAIVAETVKPADKDQIPSSDVVSWGGSKERARDNYYITEESEPAKLGSSLGWLLQLDGDNLRNAFLNAPWVKAVIPIRPGKEKAAINWLQGVDVEGTDGLDAAYAAPSAVLAEIPHSGSKVTIRDAINHLCNVVAQKHKDAMKVGRYPEEEINDDNRVSAAPVDKVYEHGFYPLQGGFRVMPEGKDFQVFDQWVEVVPTDQVVPVEVSYDPKTGRQV